MSRLSEKLLQTTLLLALCLAGPGPGMIAEPYSSQAPHFRIDPARPIEEIRREALSAVPPEQSGFRVPELLPLQEVDPTIRLDIRYATRRNFLGVPLYRKAEAYLQAPAARALAAAHRELREGGLGLLVYDAYRPWFVTRMFWDATPPDLRDYVADPDQGSRHNRGCAVDLTLYSIRTGQPLPMPSDYDDFSERAHVDYAGASAEARRNRSILQATMKRHGFEPYPLEWWHFDYRDWPHYPILNLTFQEIDGGEAAR